MKSNGDGQINRTNDSAYIDADPDWQPIKVP
jgi:hypothetical protein